MTINTRKAFLFILFITFMLLVAQFVPPKYSMTFHQKFFFDYEGNVPTWFSGILLFCVSLVAFSIHFITKDTRRLHLYFWMFFGFAYLYLSMDETAQFHELIDTFTQFKWIYLYAPFAGVFFLLCLYYFFFSHYSEKAVAFWIIGGLAVYAVGGMGMELIADKFKLSPLLEFFEVIIEECMEIIGTAMVLVGCLKQFNQEVPQRYTEC